MKLAAAVGDGEEADEETIAKGEGGRGQEHTQLDHNVIQRLISMNIE